MDEFVALIAYLLVCVGLTVVIVWPEEGLGAWVREKMLRPRLSASWAGVLDCYICCGFWVGGLVGIVCWLLGSGTWYLGGCFMVPGLFWLVLRPTE